MRTGNLRIFREINANFQSVEVIDEQERYLLNPRYRLRRESFRVLLYSYIPALGTLAGSYYMLHPRTAVLLTLFDGERTYGEVIDVFRYLFEDEQPRQVTVKGVEKLIHELQEANPELLVKLPYAEFKSSYRPSPFDVLIDADDIDLQGVKPILDFPLSINFHLNLACNRKCLYCYAPSHVQERPHMPVSRYIELFDEATENGAGEIQFTGADPLLNKNFVRLTREVLQRGYEPFISTKQYVSPQLATQLADIGLEFMQVSLDSVDADTAAKLTGCSGYLRMAMASIENLQDVGINVRVKGVATGLNIDGVPEMIRTLAAKNVVSVLIDAYGRSMFRHTDDLFVPNEKIQPCVEQINDIQRQYPDCTIITTLEPYLPSSKEQRKENWKGRAACSAGRSSMVIMTDGSVITCDQVPVEEGFILGSVAEQSIAEQWRSAGMRQVVYPEQSSMLEPCRSCEEYLVCCNQGGRCLRDVAVAFGTAAAGDPKCPYIDIPDRY